MTANRTNRNEARQAPHQRPYDEQEEADRPLEAKAMTARAVERSVLPLVDSGAITVPIAATFALADVESAYDTFGAGGKFGKIVLEI